MAELIRPDYSEAYTVWRRASDDCRRYSFLDSDDDAFGIYALYNSWYGIYICCQTPEGHNISPYLRAINTWEDDNGQE